MSDFTREEIQTLEKLCRIKCTPIEEEEFLKGLKNILDYMDLLNEIDTEGVEPCHFVQSEIQNNILREDIIGKTMPRETFLNNSPDQVGGMVKVPPIIKSEP